jgi:Zn-dependent protease
MDQNYWQLGTWRRVPVSMHWTVLISFAWLYLFFFDLLATAIAAAAFFALLVAHEFGHALLLRTRKIPVERIELFGIHGQTSYGYAPEADQILVAWGGVAAQLVVLLLALGVGYSLQLWPNPIALLIVDPVLFVFIKLNVFLMVIALIPIGPFDGRVAWDIVPRVRRTIRKRRQRAREIKLFPEEGLAPEKRRELEQSSANATAALMEKLTKKVEGPKEDA